MTRPAYPIPPWLEPVHAFVNSVDVEEGTDALAGGPAALSDWLVAQGLLTAPAEVSGRDHRRALDLRAGLRELALANNGGQPDPDALRRLWLVLGELPLVVGPAPAAESPDATPVLLPHVRSPVAAALSRIAAGYALARATGLWQRLRRCPADDCAWVFWDSSAKGARRWCSMRVCGNRAKVRAYARRHGG